MTTPIIRAAVEDDLPVLCVMAKFAAKSYGGKSPDEMRLRTHLGRLIQQEDAAVGVVEIETGLVGFFAAIAVEDPVSAELLVSVLAWWLAPSVRTAQLEQGSWPGPRHSASK